MGNFYFKRLLTNTLVISVYQIVAGFPAPIILALLINEMRNQRYKKFVQTVTYAPYFLSIVVLVGMLNVFLSPSTGIVNNILVTLGKEEIRFMTDPRWFRHLYVWSEVWQTAGWGSIIYIAALSSIDPSLYEAASIDGASKLQQMWHISLASIVPTIIILLILRMGQVMNVGFEKAFLMQNDLNMSTGDVISTYVYREGLLRAQFSYSAAVGLFNSVINLVLLLAVNFISKKTTETGLF
jgi:putative aldouronate transport system permease protein